MCTILCTIRSHAASRGGVGTRCGGWAGGAKAQAPLVADVRWRAQAHAAHPRLRNIDPLFLQLFLFFTHRLQVMTLCAFSYWLLSTIVRFWWVILYWFMDFWFGSRFFRNAYVQEAAGQKARQKRPKKISFSWILNAHFIVTLE